MLPEDPNNYELPIGLGAKVGFIGTVLAAIGYVFDAIGEGIELAEIARAEDIAKKEQLEQQEQQQQQQQQLSDIQEKLDHLLNEIEALKKRG